MRVCSPKTPEADTTNEINVRKFKNQHFQLQFYRPEGLDLMFTLTPNQVAFILYQESPLYKINITLFENPKFSTSFSRDFSFPF